MPSELVVAETNTGGVVSGTGTVDALVTEVALRLMASLPAASWMALASLLTVGSKYSTVTTSPLTTAEARVRTTVEPETTAVLTVRATPPTRTVKDAGRAVVAFSAPS